MGRSFFSDSDLQWGWGCLSVEVMVDCIRGSGGCDDKDLMDLKFVTEGVSEDDTFNIDQNNDDYSTFEGERCGICMDIVIDKGVLDCCQHWYTSLFLKKVWSLCVRLRKKVYIYKC
ncbi:hypothetical protein LOK49_LG13G00963 [Camellia lanceoleosa]|uniref:Uncharacterized protein n=1 Tax=Camellia lanceoleosa TaxID=1840588 RepID=A0ACC0FF52_9ERIC|nr:hypothetical protein LOK49_LG13G00963 [Camellia lanceoleosa]